MIGSLQSGDLNQSVTSWNQGSKRGRVSKERGGAKRTPEEVRASKAVLPSRKAEGAASKDQVEDRYKDHLSAWLLFEIRFSKPTWARRRSRTPCMFVLRRIPSSPAKNEQEGRVRGRLISTESVWELMKFWRSRERKTTRNEATNVDQRFELASQIRNVEALLVDNVRTFWMSCWGLAVPLKRVCRTRIKARVNDPSSEARQRRRGRERERTDRSRRSYTLNDESDRISESTGVVWCVS